MQQLIDELKSSLTRKEEELLEADKMSANVQSLLNNRKADIEAFEYSAKQVTNDPTLQETIIQNFKKDAERIEGLISEIKG